MRRQRANVRPQVESLEDRCLLDAALASLEPLPLAFEANQGQAPAPVQFLSRGSGYALTLEPTQAVLTLAGSEGAGAAMSLRFVGANPSPVLTGLDPLPGVVNDYRGADPAHWQTGIRTYRRIAYDELYSGIDLVFHGSRQQLEYDYVVAPGADPGLIRLAVAGGEGLALDPAGNLVIQAGGASVTIKAPELYQEQLGGARQAVPGHFVLDTGGEVGFAVGAYDSARPLVIDPIVSFSTLLGGNAQEQAMGVAVDDQGNIYVAGSTDSTDFPTANAEQGSLNGVKDAFVAKLDPSGTSLLYATYLGGAGRDFANAIAAGPAGIAFVTGATTSGDYPLLRPLQTQYTGKNDVFVTALNADGTLNFSSYLGGTADDLGQGIALDEVGNIYLAGGSSSGDFPLKNPLQPTNILFDAFVVKIAADETEIVYSTFLGGQISESAQGIAVDADGNALVTGATESGDFPRVNPVFPFGGSIGIPAVFVSKLNADGTALVYSTCLGGDGPSEGHGIAVDADGNAYVTGQTQTTNFPLFNPFQGYPGNRTVPHAFVTKLTPSGAFGYSTYLGGSSDDIGRAIAVDEAGQAYVVGMSTSTNFPIINAFQPTGSSAFVTKFAADGQSLVFSTLFGDGSDVILGVALDADANPVLTGDTGSQFGPGIPLVHPVQSLFGGGTIDAFVTKIVDRQPVHIFATGADAGGGPDVKVYDTDGQLKFNFFAYGQNFTGGVRVAVGDVNADGMPDVVCAAGPGGGPNVSVFSGQDGALLRSFFAFGQDFAGGLYVAAGDVNLDGFADIVVGADAGGGANVAVFDGETTALGQPIVPLMAFFPYGQAFTGGVRVAAGDTNGDSRADIICGAGPGGGPNVTVISGATGAVFRSFFPFDQAFTGGVYVSAGRVLGAFTDEVVVGAGAGGGPSVAVVRLRFGQPSFQLLTTFFPYDAAFPGGVRVAAVDRNGDGFDDLLTVPGPGGGAVVETFRGPDVSLLDAFFTYDPQFRGGVFIAGG